MSARARSLAEQFEQVNGEAITVFETYDDAAWHTARGAGGWPVGFTAWHIADGYTAVMGLITMVANGQPPPAVTATMLDAANAANLAQHAACGKQEALAMLREHGAATTAVIGRFPAEQLDRTAVIQLFGSAPLSVQQLIELVLAGHTRQHLASIPAPV